MTEINRKTREKIIKNCTRVVIKAGTRLLTDTARIPVLISQIAKLKEKGFKVTFVSSGAVGLGMKALKLTKRPSRLAEVQALAAIGQSKLMSLYEKECLKFGFHAAQLLLTAEDLRDRERHLNVMNCIDALWADNVLPIVNENDSVSVDELKFGDNDILAAFLGAMTRSELTIILTSVDGLYSYQNSKKGERISIVERVTDKVKSLATGTDDSSFSIGGMISKIRAAEIVNGAGENLWIANGKDPEIISKIISAEDVGTVFLPKRKQMESKKRWIRIFSKKSGKLFVDAGAVKALLKNGRSLLPSGLVSVEGSFKRGDSVEICDAAGNTVAIGISNYSASEASRVAGLKTSQMSAVLKTAFSDEELVHRNNLATSGTTEE
ncbi:MAG: glutamate 5-kinase [Lentisphaerae bacterium GWF2_44_16]|nr:MAG: glutamate 5-kinase [Lentisphaerae bacterium GWF2_44_16]